VASTQLAFDILARDRASAALDKIGGKAEGLGGKLAGIGSVAKTALGGAALGGIAALGAGFVQGVKDAASFQKLQAKTAAVIKSTGNAANISVEGVQKFAGSLESISGVDEEEIINSQNVLATFTKIRNAGPDKIFDKATKAALNMSVALGQDLQGATTMVGKALNDPIKGISAMSRAGVQFTEQQKEQIKAMVEAGDQMGAQKVILGELETQFGGAAEAAGSGFAGSMARLQDAVGDAFREIATALLPTLTSLAEWLAKHLPGAIEDFKRGLGIVSDFVSTYVWPVLRTLGEVIATVARIINDPVIPAISLLLEWFGRISLGIAGVAESVADRVRAIAGFFADLVSTVANVARTMWDPIARTFRGVINAIIGAWNRLDFAIDLRVPGWVPGIGGKGFQVDDVFPDVPTLHTGGMVTARGIAPLRADEVLARLQVGETVVPAGGMPGSGRSNTINVYEAARYDEDTLMRAIAARLA
jgi:hypothetical protein